MKFLTTSVLIVTYISASYASYCGQAGVPFSLEALPNGQPVLGCARPTCFGWNANGSRSADVAQFYTIGKKPDGFFRKTDFKGPIIKNATNFQPQFSYCDRGYLSPSCLKEQWVGGIGPLGMINASTNFQIMCCSYSKLSQATEDSQAEIRNGQSVVGGEVRDESGKQVSFEYIANVERNFDSKGIVYKVTLRRFPCPEEIEPTTIAAEASTEPSTSTPSETSQQPQQQLGQLPPESLSKKPNFDETKFDLPKELPQEDGEKTGEDFRGRKAAGEKTFANSDGSSVNSNLGLPQARTSGTPDAIRGPYPSYQQGQQVQYPGIAQQPYQLTNQIYQAPQVPQTGGVYQPTLLNPLGIFSPSNVYAPPAQASQQQAIQPIVQRVPTIGQNGQWYAQPPYVPQQPLYNQQSSSIFPLFGQTPLLASPQSSVYPSYSQSVVAQQAAPASQQAAPIKIPSVEDVENAIPPSGRKILTHVAKAFLSKKIK
uniref:Uncharacterized protein n=1 Tax=Acrobeloides nanus TaxID=290746 RepID=A0A914DWL8_9BILA